jgi:hypothetical protein
MNKVTAETDMADDAHHDDQEHDYIPCVPHDKAGPDVGILGDPQCPPSYYCLASVHDSFADNHGHCVPETTADTLQDGASSPTTNKNQRRKMQRKRQGSEPKPENGKPESIKPSPSVELANIQSTELTLGVTACVPTLSFIWMSLLGNVSAAFCVVTCQIPILLPFLVVLKFA